jgi:hypothetical protein
MKTSAVVLAMVSGAIALAGCVATKYEKAAQDTPPPVPLNLAAAQPPIELALRTVIVYNGPGSWKREALWDEYVVTIHNRAAQPLTISAAALIDFAGASHAPGVDPWTLENESQTLEQRYRRAGVDFARSAAPRALIMGASAAAGTGAGMLSAAAATAAAASVVALPVYYVVILSVNHSNKTAITAEFTRRRLVLPLTTAAGELHTGSFFFPMAPNPQSLNLLWSSGTSRGELMLSLEALHGLHATSAASVALQATP